MFKKAWDTRDSWKGYFLIVVILHVAGVIVLITAARDHPAFWGIGLLAYTFGLRHAFDVDHIAAIDNTVRKLVQQKQNPLGVGFYFALGHSTVVFIMVLAVAFSVQLMSEMPLLQEVGGFIGSLVLGGFLVMIGIMNLIILVNLFGVFRKMRSGNYKNEQLEALLEARGFFSRLVKPMFRLISRSWHVYPLGFFFGLGFDTATEIGLLALSAGAAQNSVSVFGIMSLPLLFAAGMSLMDTADGMFMTTAYRWAFYTPLRKIYYNLTVTAVSVLAALLIGVVELMQMLSEKLSLQTGFFHWIQDLDFGGLGYILVMLFAFAWALSVSIWKILKLEERYPVKELN